LTVDISRFERLPLMGIIRGVGLDEIESLMEAVIAAGLETVEVTMNTPGVADIISKAGAVSAGRASIGAGTVLSVDDLEKALEAGADFIVMPVLKKEVVCVCVERKIPVFPGALTPQEVFDAHEAGAVMVKVFPLGVFGPRYIKDLKGPFDKIKLMAVGGVRWIISRNIFLPVPMR